MLQGVIRTLRRLLYSQRIHVGRATAAAELARFFRMVRPVETDRPLIRIGGEGDGGYLIPDDLEGVGCCFSPGVSSISDFENEMTLRGIRCFLADYSVDAPPLENRLFDFEKKFLGIRSDEVFMTLENWVCRKWPEGPDAILQMDIEGSEYQVILESDRELLRRFRIIVVEFHRLEALFDAAAFELVNLAFVKLLNDFELVHAHPNNCGPIVRYLDFEVPPIMEFTFLRRDRVIRRRAATCFPHALDRRCVESRPDVVLPKCWYAG